VILNAGYATASSTLRFKLEVDVDGGRPPAEEDGRRTAGQIDAARLLGLASEPPHELAQKFTIGQLAHSAARSKLTNLRSKAL